MYFENLVVHSVQKRSWAPNILSDTQIIFGHPNTSISEAISGHPSCEQKINTFIPGYSFFICADKNYDLTLSTANKAGLQPTKILLRSFSRENHVELDLLSNPEEIKDSQSYGAITAE